MSNISVVIPVYNRADWITKTLDRIICQITSLDEVVICDDGSTDNLDEVLEAYKDIVKVVRISNSGPGAARMTGIENTKNEWIALCDSDDYWHKDHIYNFNKAVHKHPNIEFYFSNFIESNSKGISKFEKAPLAWFNSITKEYDQEIDIILCNDNLFKNLLDFQPCFQSACLFRRSLYDKVGGINPLISRLPSEDAHLTRRLAACGITAINTNASVTINKHDANFSADITKNMAGRIEILELLLKENRVPKNDIAKLKDNIFKSKLQLMRIYYWHRRYQDMRSLYADLDKTSFSMKDKLKWYLSFIRQAIHI